MDQTQQFQNTLPSERQAGDLLNRMPPANIEAERAVLGVVLAFKDAAAVAMDAMRPEYFYGFGHDKIFKAMQSIYARGEIVNPVTVGFEMQKNGTLADLGGNLYLLDMSGAALRYGGQRFIEMINIVSMLGMKRRLIEPLALALNQCYEFDKTPSVIADNIQQSIYEILRLNNVGDPLSLREIFKNEIEYIESVMAGTNLPGIATGFTKFDLHIGSLFPGDLFIIAGVPSSGKTALATTIGLNVAELLNKRVLFLSLEMQEKKFAPRIIANQAGVPHRIARLRDYRGENRKYLENVFKKSNSINGNFHAFMEGSLTALEVKTKAKKHAIVHGLDLLIVDHLHEMRKISNSHNDYEHISLGATIMKETGMELKVPVILLAQLSRDLNYRQDPRPRMSDLRGSGKIEEKADIVGMLFRPGMYDGSNSNLMEFGLEKYRDDEKRVFKFIFNGNFMRYEEAVEQPSGGDHGGNYDGPPF